METYIAVYRGPALERAKAVAVAVDPETIELVATRLLHLEQKAEADSDAVQAALRVGRVKALRAIVTEAQRFRVLLGGTPGHDCRVGGRQP